MASLEVPFALGETVWRVGNGRTEHMIVCPDCAGTRVITLILGNGTQQTMDCNLCARGYSPPTGLVEHTTYEAKPEPFICNRICGFTDGAPDYTEAPAESCGYTFAHTSDLYRDRAECEAECAKRNAANTKRDEEQAIHNLSSKRRDMAFSSHYWAGKVKSLERELELARARLSVCRKEKQHGQG